MERKHNSAAKLSLFVSFLFVLQFGWILAETCEKIDNCSCRKSNGKVISLREIDGPSGPAWVHLIATKLFFFHEWVSANLRKKSSHYLWRSVNTQQYYLIVFSKWLRFKLGSQAQWIYVLQMVNFPEVNWTQGVTLSFWPMYRYRHVLWASLVTMIGYRNQSSEN